MEDEDLGLDRPITRRDLIHGLGALAGTAVLPGVRLGCRYRQGDGGHGDPLLWAARIQGHVRQQLAGMLASGGFDPARDIQGITVNRWAHGYAYMYDWLEEPYYDNWDDERYPHVRARKPLGRIAIANSDAGASASVDSAVAQAYRAVGELT